jgi:AAA domain
MHRDFTLENAFAAYGFSGKTISAQSLALSVATGNPVWSKFPCRKGPVLHLDYEQGGLLTRRRYKKLAEAMGIPVPTERELCVLSGPKLPRLDMEAFEKDLISLIRRFSLVIIDSLRAACPTVDENSSNARAILDVLGRASEHTKTVVLVIHHGRKPARNHGGDESMHVRGSSALFDACSSVFLLGAKNKRAPSVAGQARLSFTHHKARASGILQSPFSILLQDNAERDTTSVLFEEQGEDDESPTDEELEAKILQAVREQPEALGRGGIRDAVSANREVVNVIIERLESDGRLWRRGKRDGYIVMDANEERRKL